MAATDPFCHYFVIFEAKTALQISTVSGKMDGHNSC
jgi:hypothetical protein